MSDVERLTGDDGDGDVAPRDSRACVRARAHLCTRPVRWAALVALALGCVVTLVVCVPPLVLAPPPTTTHVPAAVAACPTPARGFTNDCLTNQSFWDDFQARVAHFFADWPVDHPRVVVFMMMSADSYPKRVSPGMRDTWLRDAIVAGIYVQPYAPRTSCAALLPREPTLMCLAANDSYPPFAARIASLRAFAHLAARSPHVDYMVHVDDDTYAEPTRVLALARSLDAAAPLYVGRVNYHEPDRTRAYCGGPFVLYSHALLRALGRRASDERLLAMEDAYHAVVSGGDGGDDVLTGFVIQRVLGVRCTCPQLPGAPPGSDPVRQAMPYSLSERTEYLSYSVDGQPGTYAWHKVLGPCARALHDGHNMTTCLPPD